jgi:hypothetical protein
MTLRATVLIPTHDHGPTLVHSVGTALAQTVTDIEVIIVGDGVGANAREIVADLQRGDSRVRFVDLPKAPRYGENNRHTALAEARGRIVCYLSDDDLWLPNHIAVMESLLQGHVGFAHTLPLWVGPTGRLRYWAVDLAIPYYRDQTMADRNWVPLSSGGHTLDAYRRLPLGWSTTPARLTGTTTYMWQKLLVSGCGVWSGTQPTVLVFPSSERAGWPIERRVRELEPWRQHLREPDWLASFQEQTLDHIVRERARALSVTPRARTIGLLARTRLLNPIRRLRKAARRVFARGAR